MSDIPPVSPKGYLQDITAAFEEGGKQLFADEKAKRNDLTGPDGNADPTKLAQYQAIVSEVTILRNAQSSTVKLFKDVDATIVANFR